MSKRLTLGTFEALVVLAKITLKMNQRNQRNQVNRQAKKETMPNFTFFVLMSFGRAANANGTIGIGTLR
jgi:hypothetical protein